jgi:transposase InsO family protein
LGRIVSSLFAEICKLFEIKKTRTTSYRPCYNGIIEKFNGTLEKIIYAQNQYSGNDNIPFAHSGFDSKIILLLKELFPLQRTYYKHVYFSHNLHKMLML